MAEISELPNEELPGQPRTSRNARTTAQEGARLLSIARKLGNRLKHATAVRWLGPEYTPAQCEACGGACGHELPGKLPDDAARQWFAEYWRCVAALLKEERERIGLIYKYKLQPKMGEAEMRAKIAEIVRAEIEVMEDSELEQLLQHRREMRALDVGST